MAEVAEDKEAANNPNEQNGTVAGTEAIDAHGNKEGGPDVEHEEAGAHVSQEIDANIKEDSKEDINDTNDEPKDDAHTEKRKASMTSAADDHQDRKRPRADQRPFQKNNHIHSRFDDQPESNDADDIRRQVEFYFSDSNLPIDDFLLGLTGGPKNNPVDLKIIHNFKRMRHFQPYSAVRDAVKASTFLDVNDQDQITRKVPLDAKFTDDAAENRTLVHQGNMSRSIYAKGFGDEGKRTHLDIESFFAPYGPLNSVRLRRDGRGGFKGSVFVEFEKDELQQQFLELETKPQWDGKDLLVMSKQEYVDSKHNGILEGVVKPRSPIRNNGRGGRYRRSDDWEKRGSKEKLHKDDWKARRDRDQEDDRRERGGRSRGYKSHRGGRGGRGGRRRSPDVGDRKRRERDASEDSNQSTGQSKKRTRDEDFEESGDTKKPKVDSDATEVQQEA